MNAYHSSVIFKTLYSIFNRNMSNDYADNTQ
uniref:Uncharacterized protein n=1 Tax=Arundo donax TaxID=35708 RepID=A0A0A9HBQ6_ARUDO